MPAALRREIGRLLVAGFDGHQIPVELRALAREFGLGGVIVPDLVSHPLASRGVIASLLGALWLLAFVGLRYPVQMLPLLMFEFVWKALWAIAYGLPQWLAGQYPPTFSEDAFSIGMGVILMPLVIPWGYAWRHYVTRPGDRWR